jgi:ABC-2 type transport system permease protein
MIRDYILSVLTIIKKDLRVWLRQPANIASTFVPALCFLLVSALGSAAVGKSPVALVTLDHGRDGIQMQQIFHHSDALVPIDATPAQAQALFKKIQVVAIITIPANFTQLVEAHLISPVDVNINNLNLDFTNDIRRAVPDAITAFYQSQGRGGVIKIGSNDQNMRKQDIALFQYSVLPTIILLLTIAGVVNCGLSTAREWESQTVKELLLAPVARSAIITGKVLAGFFTTMLLGAAVLVIGSLLGWVHPEGIYWLNALIAIGLIALMGSGLGVAMGATMQRMQPVISIGINAVLYLFFLAGGVGVLAFMSDWFQNVAAFVPLTYGRHALEMAVFYNSSDLFGRDVAVLGASSVVALGLGVLAMRRSLAR